MGLPKFTIVPVALALTAVALADPVGGAFSEIVKVNAGDASATRALASDVTSAVGRNWVRAPDVVTTEPDWSLTTSPPRACPRFSDMDFATTPDLPADGRHELSVVFTHRSRPAVAGPDVFVFSLWRNPGDAGVRTVYITPSGEVTYGRRMPVADASVSSISVAGRSFFGIGVDVDAWTQSGDAPPGAACAGIILDYDRSNEQFAPVKIMLVEDASSGAASASFLRQALAATGSLWNAARSHLFSTVPVRDDPGGPGGPRRPSPPTADSPPEDPPETPSPGPMSIALIAGAYAARRRRRFP